MPELPEVETIRRSLLPHVPGATVLRVDVRERRFRKPIEADFEQRLTSRRIEDIGRRGKYLLFAIGKGESVLSHMGMSGTLDLREPTAASQPHDHVVLSLSTGFDLIFNDPRRFGVMRIGRNGEFSELANIGADPLLEEWPADRLKVITRNRQIPIKSLLLDQKAIGGLGNIYASEILFQAKIRPKRRASSLRRTELECLALAIHNVIHEAVRQGGSSISDFRDGTGRQGYFQLQLAVYDRDGAPCLTCGALIRRIVQSGRSSFYCSSCQR